jgi:hypothetical protein
VLKAHHFVDDITKRRKLKENVRRKEPNKLGIEHWNLNIKFHNFEVGIDNRI